MGRQNISSWIAVTYIVMTQNAEAKAVNPDIKSYKQGQETLALLKILALGNRQMEDGRVQSVDRTIAYIRARRRHRQAAER